MTIEQTNQLISLILNSALMTLLSAVLLGGAWLRQNLLCERLQQVRSRYQSLTQVSDEALPLVTVRLEKPTLQAASLKQVRVCRQRLLNQYRWSHVGLLALHMTLVVFSVSLLSLSLRSLLAFDVLISTALFLFTVGAAGLLAGVGCILIDVAQGTQRKDSLPQLLGRGLMQISYFWSRLRQRPPMPRTALALPAKVHSGDVGND